MPLYSLIGQRAAELLCDGHLRQLHEEELGAEPEVEATNLSEKIQNGTLETLALMLLILGRTCRILAWAFSLLQQRRYQRDFQQQGTSRVW